MVVYEYFRNILDAQYDILTNSNIISSAPNIAVEYAGLIFEVKGKNGEVGYGYTPAFTFGDVTSSNSLSMRTYVYPKGRYVQGYHTHGRANNHVYDPENGNVDTRIVNFFSFPNGTFSRYDSISPAPIPTPCPHSAPIFSHQFFICRIAS